MNDDTCPRCTHPLDGSVRVAAGDALRICAHCRGFLEAAGDGFRSLMPGDLERLPENVRWQLLRARAELGRPG